MMSRLALPQTLRLVIALNVGMFVIESAIAFSVGSVSLIADSVDFLEDASINLLVLVGLAMVGAIAGAAWDGACGHPPGSEYRDARPSVGLASTRERRRTVMQWVLPALQR